MTTPKPQPSAPEGLVERLEKNATCHELIYGHRGLCGEAAALIEAQSAEIARQITRADQQADWALREAENAVKLERQLAAAQDRVARLEGVLQGIGRKAAAHPDDTDADRKRYLWHIENAAAKALADTGTEVKHG